MLLPKHQVMVLATIAVLAGESYAVPAVVKSNSSSTSNPVPKTSTRSSIAAKSSTTSIGRSSTSRKASSSTGKTTSTTPKIITTSVKTSGSKPTAVLSTSISSSSIASLTANGSIAASSAAVSLSNIASSTASSSSSTAQPTPYVLGTIGWAWASDATDSARAQITDSMDWVINQLNTLTDYYGTIQTVYNADTPTADASFLGQVRFGAQMNRRAALHEVDHWLGSGTYWEFPQLVSNGAFTGNIANQRISAYDGAGAVLYSDGVHFWPYGMNYDNEFTEPQRTVGIVAAERADMGMGDGTAAIVGDRLFQNRASGLLLNAGTGSNAFQANYSASLLAWKTGFVDGFVTLTASNGTLSLDSLGNTANAALTAMYPPLWWHPNQHWEMIPTDNGWFMLRNKGTGTCLDNNANQGEGAPMTMWGCGGSFNQQWHLVR